MLVIWLFISMSAYRICCLFVFETDFRTMLVLISIDPETGAPRFRKPPPKEEPEPKKKWFRFA